jgi:hypothetical protein
MTETKHGEEEHPEYRSLTAAAIAGAAGGTASAVANQALAKLGSLAKQKREPRE